MVTVTPITQAILGRADAGTCALGQMRDSDCIALGTFIPHDLRNRPRFQPLPGLPARMGVFAATEGSITRSFILTLPETGTADRVLFFVPPAIGQASDYYLERGGRNPQSRALILDSVGLISGDPRDGKVNPFYGTQVLRAGRPRAFIMPVRVLAARDEELGPFGYQGALFRDTLRAIATASGNLFDPNQIELVTHSNGTQDCNRLIRACNAAGVGIRAGIALDPFGAVPLVASPLMVVRQYLSGHTGGIVNGRPVGNFIFMPQERWQHEPERARVMRSFHNSVYDYLHNYTFPKYLLKAALEDIRI